MTYGLRDQEKHALYLAFNHKSDVLCFVWLRPSFIVNLRYRRPQYLHKRATTQFGNKCEEAEDQN